MNPRESALDSFLDEFASEQTESVDFVSDTFPSFSSISSTFNFALYSAPILNQLLPMNNTPVISPSSERVTSSSISAAAVNSTDDFIQLQNLIKRTKRVMCEYEAAHRTFQSNSTLAILTHTRPGNKSRDDVISCFSTVPAIFFRPNFALQESDIFQQTQSLSEPKHSNGRVAKQSISCQDRLAMYLDTVEITLLRQIWTRSPDFFRALEDISGLRDSVTDACKSIAEMRTRLRSMDSEVALTAMRIPQLHLRHQNEKRLEGLLLEIQRSQEGCRVVQSLLRVGDLTGALQLANETLQHGATELENVKCVEGVRKQLRAVITEVGDKLTRRFVDLALEWSESDAVVPDDALQIRENDPLDTVMSALLSANLLERAVTEYKNKLCDNVRLVVRTCVTEYLSSFDPLTWASNLGDALFEETAAGADDTPFAQRVRGMGSEDFLSALSFCVENLLLSLQRTSSVNIVICRSIRETSSEVIEQSKQCVTAACNLAQRSISQLLKIRRESTVRLALDKMKFLSELCRHFLTSLEKIHNGELSDTAVTKPKQLLSNDINETNKDASGTFTYELTKTLRTQSREFLDRLHEAHKTRLVSTLDTDRWVQTDVAPERQLDIDRLVSGRSFITSKATDTPTSGTPGVDKRRDCRPVTVDGTPYRVVWSCLLLCEQIIGYLDISSVLVCISAESVAKDTIPKMVELLRLFDSRTRLLVLCAGAIQSAARLKSISAKHLAFAAQSLGLLKSLVPHLRASLLAVLHPKHHMLLADLDRAANDYIDHHGLIIAKLVTIAGDSLDASSQRLRTVDWDRFQGQCEYIEEVLRNISALHRVLLEALPPEQLKDIFTRIFMVIGRKVPQHFEELNVMPSTQTGRQRILDEIAQMVVTLGRLKQVESGPSLAGLEDVFRRRYAGR